MSHIANMRIKKDGKIHKVGQPVSLTEEDLARLPQGAATAMTEEAAEAFAATAADLAIKLQAVLSETAEQAQDEKKFQALKAAVAGLPEEAFRVDGDARADTLKTLSADLGFDVTAEAVAIVRTSNE
ncbi:hypothetical protein [Epibacterium ulvae]|uniref:hypothetical protein n=1 Tax=Epibacterium ulvae TaxID=1156985 RepID=UPI002490E07F|nr:hypothetical protein [Epibacterium ulvae]